MAKTSNKLKKSTICLLCETIIMIAVTVLVINKRSNVYENSAMLNMSDGASIPIKCVTSQPANIESGDDYIVFCNNLISVTYSDSYVKENTADYFKSLDIDEDNFFHEANIYYSNFTDTFGVHKGYILQDVGASNYLSIKINDYKNNYSIHELIEMFALNLEENHG